MEWRARRKPWQESFFSAEAGEPETKVNHAWFRGDWWDAVTLAWKDVATSAAYDAPPPASGLPSPGAASSCLSPWRQAHRAPFRSGFPGIRAGDLRSADDPFAWPWPQGQADTYRPWYAGRFDGIESVSAYWRDHYQTLRDGALRFRDCFHDSTLPPEVVEAVSANLGILKSPTILRQADGRILGLGRLRRQFRFAGRHGLLHPCVELRPVHAASVSRVGADLARNRIRPLTGRDRPSGFPARPAYPALPAQILCRRRRPIGRHHESLSRMAHQRRH